MHINNHFAFHIMLPATLLAAFVCGCSNRPSEVLSDKEAASLLADLHIADAYGTLEVQSVSTDGSDLDSTRKVLRQSILSAHGVSEAQLDTTLGWYGHNLDKYEEMYELVIEQIEKKRERLSKEQEKANASPTLWPAGNMQRMAGSNSAPALFTFEIQGAKIPKGGRLQWDAKTINTRDAVEIFMAVEYPGGVTGYIQRTLMGDGWQSVALQTDSATAPKRAYGYLRVKQTQPLLLDSISLKALPFSTTSYYEIHGVKTWTPS